MFTNKSVHIKVIQSVHLTLRSEQWEHRHSTLLVRNKLISPLDPETSKTPTM